MFTNHENLEGLSTTEDVNTNMAKALNVMRLAVHSKMPIGSYVYDVYRNADYGLKEQYSTKQFEKFSKEQQYGLVTEAVNEYLNQNQMIGDRVNSFVGIMDSVINHEFVTVNNTPQRIRVIRFKPNMEIIGNELDFTQQVRIIQKDFASMPKEIQNFFVAYDFLTTGWGSNGNSISPFFSQEKIRQINDTSKRANRDGSFEQDLASYIKKNELYNAGLFSNPKQDAIVNARRVAALSYLALFGNDGKLDKKGLFNIQSETIGASGANTVTTIQDAHWKSDRFEMRKEDVSLTTRPLEIFSGVQETAMLNVFGEAMRQPTAKASNSMEFESGDKQYLKVPVYEFPGTDYQGVGNYVF